MATQIFVNLAVKDLNKSIEFFSKLGYTFNPQFSDENATSMVISDTIYVMLLVEPFFQTFIKQPIADAKKVTEVIIALSADSRQAVDDIVEKAVKGGATVSKEPQDHGWMYSRSFQDLDGHQWEYAYMDLNALNQATS